MLSELPTLEQLQTFRRTGKVKVDVCKSTAPVIAIKDKNGRLIGYGTDPEHMPPPPDLNSVFDSLFSEPAPAPVTVQKSAGVTDPNTILEGIFPQWLRTSSPR